MKVIAITSGEQSASTRYRLSDYRSFLNSQGIQLTCIPKNKLNESCLEEIRSADLVINQKCLIDLKFSRKILKNSKRMIFDFDDALYTRPGKPYSLFTQWRVARRLKFWIRNAECVTVANRYLASYAANFAKKVEVVPMALNLDYWVPERKMTSTTITLGWAGAPHNLWYLEKIDPVLKTLLNRHSSLKLAVFCGEKPKLDSPFDYFPYTPDSEATFVQSLDIGLLPLPEEEYSRGKSPIKAIQYLACGIPVIGNIIGATNEIVDASTGIHVKSSSEWITAIEQLIVNPALRSRMGDAGRCLVKNVHNQSETGKLLLKIIKGV